MYEHMTDWQTSDTEDTDTTGEIYGFYIVSLSK